jgi:ABC-type phosphate transport system substrate-binding protein
VGKSVAEVNAYWAKLLFTGRASPPRSLTDSETVLQVVRENRNAIGYIESEYADDTVRVVGKVQ